MERARRALHELMVVRLRRVVRLCREFSRVGACLAVSGGVKLSPRGSFCELSPAGTDQVFGILGRHLDGAIRADVEVPA